jgi:oligoendopeptidase F
MNETPKTLSREPRIFLPEDFNVSDWDALEPYFQELLDSEITYAGQLRSWFRDRSELEAAVSEDLAWRYINMTCDTSNETYQQSYQFFIAEIQPKIAPFSNKLNEKALKSPFWEEIREEGYDILHRSLKTELEIFREENIPLFTEIQTLSKEFGTISGAMMVELEGQEYTLQQASVRLQLPDRDKRETAYFKILERRLDDKEKLDELFNQLIGLRHQVAVNADFENFRDFMFAALGRFDYTPNDCFNFHSSVAEEVVPFLNSMSEERKRLLKVSPLRPWDKAVDPAGREPLKPFDGSKDLTYKTIECFRRLDPFLGECLTIMKDMGHLDLESRKGKAPGGYNYPLAEVGVPFIFMNATSTLRDMITILHEGGHAIHSFVTRDLELGNFKETPSEVAELASMAMELISMDHWDVYFDNPDDLKRAKKEHLEQILETLPWVATIDKFQHWIYENHEHSIGDRIREWNNIFNMFSDDITDWSDLQTAKDYLWQKQLHLYEVPFYYIEYGMAQLGALAVWKNFKQDPAKGLENYLNALKLGYKRPIPEIYKAAKIKFDFSKEYIRDLMQFVRAELETL